MNQVLRSSDHPVFHFAQGETCIPADTHNPVAYRIDTMLSALPSLCADGSTLVFDYPGENFFEAPEKRVQNTIMMAKAGGEPMQSAFSYGALEKLLEKHGFLIYELLTPEDIQRDIIDKAGSDMKAFEHGVCLTPLLSGTASAVLAIVLVMTMRKGGNHAEIESEKHL